MKVRISKEELWQAFGLQITSDFAELEALPIEGEKCRLCKHGDVVGDCAHDCHTPKSECKCEAQRLAAGESQAHATWCPLAHKTGECCVNCKAASGECINPECPCHKREERVALVPSPRIDWCGRCKKEHGYDCPADRPKKIERLKYWECKGCASKPGAPHLCHQCLFNRDFVDTINELIDYRNNRI